MKKSKKKGGFTLVEIIIAFAIFSIFAVMIVQVLNLTVNRRKSNDEFQKNLANQEQNLYAKPKDTTYDSAASADGQLDLTFQDTSGATSMTINYQYKNANDSVADVKAGINYFTGELDYDGEIGGTYGGTSGVDTSNPEDAPGSILNRYDARIIGTKGMTSVQVNSITPGATSGEYTVNVNINKSGVSADYDKLAQVSLFFGSSTDGYKILSVSSNFAGNGEKLVKKTGLNGVNIHCDGSGNLGSVSFIIKLNKPLPAGFNQNSFGEGVTDGVYKPMSGAENIYGAYSLSTPTTSGGESS